MPLISEEQRPLPDDLATPTPISMISIKKSVIKEEAALLPPGRLTRLPTIQAHHHALR